MKLLISATILVIVSALGGYKYAEVKIKREHYINYLESVAIDTVLPAKILYAARSNKYEESIPWVIDDICTDLIIIGNSIDEFPEIASNDNIKDTLSLLLQYASDYNTSYCMDDEIIVEKKAMELAGTQSPYKNFLEKYGKAEANNQQGN